MIATKHKNMFGILYLTGKEQTNDLKKIIFFHKKQNNLKRISSTINIISEKKVAFFMRWSTSMKNTQQVSILPMDISTHKYWPVQLKECLLIFKWLHRQVRYLLDLISRVVVLLFTTKQMASNEFEHIEVGTIWKKKSDIKFSIKLTRHVVRLCSAFLDVEYSWHCHWLKVKLINEK